MKNIKQTTAPITVTGCCFYGVKWDEKATSAVLTIAEAIKSEAQAAEKRATAMIALAEVFKASNVTIEPMLKIEGTK